MGPINGRHGRLLVPILGGLAVVAMALAGYGFYLQNQEHRVRLQKEQELASLLQERDALQVQIASLQTAKTKVEDELAGVKDDLEDAKQEISKGEKERQTLSASLEQRQGELAKITQAMDQMMKELAQARTDREKLSTELAKLNTERETLSNQLDQAKEQQQSLESKISELSRVPTVQLEKVRVTSAEQEPTAASIPGPTSRSPATSTSGQVLVINRDYDFVVMDLGKNQGLSVGQQFKIVRGDQTIGTVKVEKVYDDLCAAAILPDTKEEAIREGDQVRAL